MAKKKVAPKENEIGEFFNALADLAAEKGIEVIVTDHHQPPEELPEAVAILDAHIPGSSRCYTELAGVGVAFKLACALEGDISKSIKKQQNR